MKIWRIYLTRSRSKCQISCHYMTVSLMNFIYTHFDIINENSINYYKNSTYLIYLSDKKEKNIFGYLLVSLSLSSFSVFSYFENFTRVMYT